MLKLEYTQNIKDEYYSVMSKSKADAFTGLTFEEYYNKHFKAKLEYSLKDILCGDFEKLLEIKDNHGTKFSKDNAVKKLFNYDKVKSKKFTPKISKLQPKISKFIEAKAEVHTCYFCNIDSINKFKIYNGKTKNGFTLDHFLDKATYPYFALSLYNLIPSCYICNTKVKGKYEIDKSPSASDFDFDERVKFRTFMSNENLQIGVDKDFELLLKEDFSNIYKNYINTLELDGRYEYHKYKVIEMINKRKKYPDSRITELAELTKQTEEEVKQDLFGEYIFDDGLSKRPFSKLIKDISQELGIV
ncbi:MAG: hypothetical protein COB99_04065 [Sulfurimonas sp.]|nr:MAG: hypothetical protein COB99_04065 [Sulfurimonas sp.]